MKLAKNYGSVLKRALVESKYLSCRHLLHLNKEMKMNKSCYPSYSVVGKTMYNQIDGMIRRGIIKFLIEYLVCDRRNKCWLERRGYIYGVA